MSYSIYKKKLDNGKDIKLSISKHEYKYIWKEIIDNECYFSSFNGNNFKINEKDIIIDIGANVGVFSIYAGHLAKNGKVYSFEPVKNNFDRLNENIKINKLNNIITENVGISDKRKEALIYFEKSNTGGHSMHRDKYEHPDKTIRGTGEIRVIPLAEVFEKNKIKKCNFLKIDCEGEEDIILRSLPVKYFKIIDKIVLEFHPNVDEIKLADFLRKQGYRVTISDIGEVIGLIFAYHR